jgi:hypothetical protein
MERQLAQEAGALARTDEVRRSLGRAVVALRRELSAMPAALAEELGLTLDQQRRLRASVEERLRAFVVRLRESGLPDVD